jgi:hypothetical protein
MQRLSQSSWFDQSNNTNTYLMKGANYKATHCVIFFILLLLSVPFRMSISSIQNQIFQVRNKIPVLHTKSYDFSELFCCPVLHLGLLFQEFILFHVL